MTYGQALGKLIAQKRKILGLTQLQLAEDAFGTHAKVRRISELENGSVSNPHPKTIDPIIVALKITSQELSECAKSESSMPNPTLDRAYNEAFDLINNLAEQFDYKNPDATIAALESFLCNKAKEYFELKDSILKIESTDAEIEKIKNSALEALSKGDFTLVDELLIQAESIQQDRNTLIEIRKQYEIRILRGNNKFLAGEPDEALKLYKSAAKFFEPFNELDMVDALQNLAQRVYESSRRALEPSLTLYVAQDLLNEALSARCLRDDAKSLSSIHYRLSLIYRNDAFFSDEIILDKGIYHAREAVKGFINTDEQFEKISAQISLGNCLSDKGDLLSSGEDLDGAIEIFKSVKFFIESENLFPNLLGHVCNSLGASYLRKTKVEKPEQSKHLIKCAKAAYADAIKSCEDSGDPEIWGVSNLNMGKILAKEAREFEEDNHLLRLRAISAFMAAIETYPSALFPYPFAEAHVDLAETLFRHGLSYEDHELAEIYFARSLDSFMLASQVYNQELYPDTWAYIQYRMGSIFSVHGQMSSAHSPQDDFRKAISFFEAAKSTLKETNNESLIKSCEDNIQKISECMNA